jgi:hypothetical protein
MTLMSAFILLLFLATASLGTAALAEKRHVRRARHASHPPESRRG